MSGDATTVCALCGFTFAPGGAACAERGCPLAGSGCRTLDCPQCGYAVPDERASRLAGWVRRLFARCAATEEAANTLADLRPGEDAIVVGIEGDRSESGGAGRAEDGSRLSDISGETALAARLTAQGLAPGVAIHLVQRVPSYVIEVGAMTLALERRVARAIRIRSAGSRE